MTDKNDEVLKQLQIVNLKLDFIVKVLPTYFGIRAVLIPDMVEQYSAYVYGKET